MGMGISMSKSLFGLLFFIGGTLLVQLPPAEKAHVPNRVPAAINFELEAEKFSFYAGIEAESLRQFDYIHGQGKEIKAQRGLFAKFSRESAKRLIQVKEVTALMKLYGASFRAPVITFLVSNFVMVPFFTFVSPSLTLAGFFGLPHETWVAGLSLWRKAAQRKGRIVRELGTLRYDELFSSYRSRSPVFTHISSERQKNQMIKQLGRERYAWIQSMKKKLTSPEGFARVNSFVYDHLDEETGTATKLRFEVFKARGKLKASGLEEALTVEELESIVNTHTKGGRDYLDSIYKWSAKKRTYTMMLLHKINRDERALAALRNRMVPLAKNEIGSNKWARQHLGILEDYRVELQKTQMSYSELTKKLPNTTKSEKKWVSMMMQRRLAEFDAIREDIIKKEILFVNSLLNTSISGGDPMDLTKYIEVLRSELNNRRKVLDEIRALSQDSGRPHDVLRTLEAELYGDFEKSRGLKAKCTDSMQKLIGWWPNFIGKN